MKCRFAQPKRWKTGGTKLTVMVFNWRWHTEENMIDNRWRTSPGPWTRQPVFGEMGPRPQRIIKCSKILRFSMFGKQKTALMSNWFFFSGEECKDALGTLPQTEELHQKDNDTLINQVFKCRCTLKQFLLLANGMIFCICHLPFVVS